METPNVKLSVNKYKVYLVPAILLVLSIILVLLVGLPSFKSHSSLKIESENAANNLSKLTEKRLSLEKVASLSGALDDNLLLIKKALPDENEIPALLSQIQQVANEAGTELDSITYSSSSNQRPVGGSEKNTASPNEIFVQTSVSGTYQQAIKILDILEKARRVVTIDSVRLDLKAKEDPKVLNYSLALKGYYLEAKGTVSSTDKFSNLDIADYNNILEEIRSYREYENIEVVPEIITDEDVEREEG